MRSQLDQSTRQVREMLAQQEAAKTEISQLTSFLDSARAKGAAEADELREQLSAKDAEMEKERKKLLTKEEELEVLQQTVEGMRRPSRR